MPAVFVIYLIQEHTAVRSNLWNFINIAKWAETPWLLPIIVFVFLSLAVAALLLNLLYQLAHKLFIKKAETTILNIFITVREKLKK